MITNHVISTQYENILYINHWLVFLENLVKQENKTYFCTYLHWLVFSKNLVTRYIFLYMFYNEYDNTHVNIMANLYIFTIVCSFDLLFLLLDVSNWLEISFHQLSVLEFVLSSSSSSSRCIEGQIVHHGQCCHLIFVCLICLGTRYNSTVSPFHVEARMVNEKVCGYVLIFEREQIFVKIQDLNLNFEREG